MKKIIMVVSGSAPPTRINEELSDKESVTMMGSDYILSCKKLSLRGYTAHKILISDEISKEDRATIETLLKPAVHIFADYKDRIISF